MSKIKSLLILLITVTLLPLNISAANNLTLEVDKTDLTVGDEITVSASIPSDMKSYAVSATLKYDEKVFEKIDDSNFDIDKEKKDISYNTKNNKFGIINKSGNTSSKLFSVHLKVKEDANVGDTNIAITNTSASDGKNIKTFDTVSTKVSVTRDAKDKEAIPINEENKITEDKEEIIKTFAFTPILIILSVVALILFVVCLYIFVYKYKNNKKKFYCLVAICAILLVAIAFLFVFNNNKSDVNKDGKKDYDDAKAIIDYLIDIENEKSPDSDSTLEESLDDDSIKNTNSTNTKKKETKFSMDVNNDGKVDVKDSAIVVSKVNESIKVELKEQKVEENYIKKGEEVILNFKADINKKDLTIKQVKIKDKYYDVTLNNGVYSVKLDTPEKAGKYTFEITEVVLSNDEKIKANLKVTKEILKDVPYVNKFNLDDKKGSLSFNLEDEDNAFIDGDVTIYKGDNKIASGKVSKDETTLEFEAKEDETYVVKIVGSYDLDSKTGDKKNAYNNQDMFTETFMIGGDYNFTLTNASITDVIQENETPIISFTSTNNRNASVVTANMTTKENTTDYQITKVDGNNYEVELKGADTNPGKHTVTLNNVGLNSLKTFYNDKDYKARTLTYTVLKDAPKVEDLKLTDDHTEKNIKVSFKLNDEFEATNKLTVVLVDTTGKIVNKKEITKDELKNNIDITLSYKDNTDGFYTVKVLADYELSDSYKYTNKSLEEQEILTTTDDDIYISDMSIDGGNLYPTKDKKDYRVVFTVIVGDSVKAIAPAKYSGRAYNQIQSITINGLNYSVDAVSGYPDNSLTTYKVKANLIIPNESGILKIKANRVQLGMNGYYNMTKNDMYSVKEKEIDIDVLKDKPKIENLKVTDNYEKGEATFDFDLILDDKATGIENDFNNGTIKFGDVSKPIQKGHNNITLEDIKKDENLDLIFNGNYDLDTDTLPEDPDKNTTINGELLKVKYGLFKKDIYDDITIENGKAVSEKNNNYFEKNEKIKLNFDILNIDPNLEATPSKVIIDNKEYTLIKTENNYELLLDGYHSSGKKEITITDIILNNGKKVTLKDSYTFTLEVLKDTPYINDFTYEDLNDQIKVKLDLKDVDNTIIDKAKVIITDENGKEIYNKALEKEFTFKRDKNVLRYYLKVITDYDRDIDIIKDSDNYYKQDILLDEVISLASEVIELKDITDVNLYKSEEKNGIKETILIDEISKNELDSSLDSYFVEIIMRNMSNTFAKIKEVKEIDEHLILVLNYKYVTKDDETINQTIRINFGKINENKKAFNEIHPATAFKVLLEELKSGNDVELTRDYDASAYFVNTNYYVESYSGTLKGNRHIIKNLTKPLFNSVSDGKIENLKLENITFSNNMKGVIANTGVNEELKGIFIHKFVNKNTPAGSGALVGSITGSSIEECRVTDFNLTGGGFNQQFGGLVGTATNTTIKDNYVNGSISGGWNYRGGLIGMADNCTVEHNYTKVSFGCSYGCDGLVNGILSTNKNNNTITNNVSFSNAFGPISNDGNSKGPNYYYNDNEVSNLSEGVIRVTSNDINEGFFKTKVGFDETIWELKDTSIKSLPTLILENKTDLEDVKGYKKDLETLYKNLMKLMPFYNDNKIVELAFNVKDSLFIDDELVHIVPVDKSGHLITYLTTDNPKAISKIKLVFKSGKDREYNVTYDKIYDMVATYKIPDLNLDYSYNHYVINTDSQIVNNLTNYLKGLDYTNNLDVLTTNDDSRIYRDFYNSTTKNELKDFVLKYLSNSNYANTINDDGINSYIEREVKKDKKIERVLYAYNYFRRFYDLDIDGMKLYDFVMFNMQGFNEILTPEKITDLYFNDGKGTNFATNTTGSTYKNILSEYTKIERISKFLEYFVTHFSDEDMNKWIANQFKGILVEIPVKGHDEIEYTLWDHFSNEDAKYSGDGYAVYNYVLPILTLPDTAAYIISAPAQFTIGAQRVYMGNPTDPEELTKFKDKMKVYTERISSYYNTAYSILQDPKLFNDIHLYQVDKRMTKNENNVSVYNNPYSTEEPFHKNFDEVVNIWPANYWVNAGNWGDRIEWNVAGFMDSDIKNDGNIDANHPTWATWSHETAHYLDGRLFLKTYDRRFDAGGEDYADEFLMQKFGMGVVMNLSIKYNDDAMVATNLDPERINSKENIHSFYSRMYDSIYALDYIEAMAFLKLDSENQKALGVQISYPLENYKFQTIDGKSDGVTKECNYETCPENFLGKTYNEDPYAKFRARQTTRYTRLSILDNVPKLETIDDLIKNRIMLYTNLEKQSSRGSNSYGGEGIDIVHWYQPNNPEGRPDSYSLKWFSYEMLGYKGYDEGFVEYASNINFKPKQIYASLTSPFNGDGTPNLSTANFKSDDMAITKISNGDYHTIDDYKLARFKQTGEKLKHLKIINVDEYAEKLYNALLEDAKNKSISYAKSAIIRKEIYFALKRGTNDFREDIYSDSENQEITFNTNMFDDNTN